MNISNAEVKKPLKSSGASQFIQDGNGKIILFSNHQARLWAIKHKRKECAQVFITVNSKYYSYSAC